MAAEYEESKDSPDAIARMNALLAKQRAAHMKHGTPSYEWRIERLDRLIGLMVDYQDEIADVISEDFGHRSREQTLLSDVADSVGCAKHCKAHLRKWMKTQSRGVGIPMLKLFGAKSELQFQPKGVIGIVAPWNFPVNLVLNPLSGVIAAGNRAIIKPSEYTPRTSELLERMMRTAFDEDEVAVVQGGPEVGEAFTKLPFDHLVFTGATSVARHVMRAASENLVPLTLELGGKSPVILGETADMEVAAGRIMQGNTLNSGQICLAPDYVMVPEANLQSFVDESTKAVHRMFPTIRDNPDYTSIINQRHYDRLQGYVEDAKAKGAEIVEINPANEDFSQQPHRKIPPTLVLNPTDDMKIMQEEIFGPLLPVKAIKSTDEAIDYVNEHDRPLGLYYFGADKAEQEKILTRTTSGGVTVNDVLFHISQHDLPFGGIGPAGMGSYHGEEGFREFSHAKSVYTQVGRVMGKDPLAAQLHAPYDEKKRAAFKAQVKR